MILMIFLMALLIPIVGLLTILIIFGITRIMEAWSGIWIHPWFKGETLSLYERLIHFTFGSGSLCLVFVIVVMMAHFAMGGR